MIMFSKIIFFKYFILIFILINLIDAKKELFCIHKPKSAYSRYGDNRFTFEDIDPTLCTHLVYTYFGITDAGELISKNPMVDNYGGNIAKFNSLKRANNNLKTLLGIGGWDNEPSAKYSDVAADPIKRQNFIKSTIAFIKMYRYNGIALHWCFPGLFGGDPIYDKVNFSIWLKEIKEAFKKENLILMVMVQGIIDRPDLSYEMDNISKYVDYIYLTTYDFYGVWRNNIGLGAGLYKSRGERLDYLNVDYMVQDWIRGGADPKKLIMAIPFFARTFTLEDENKNKPGARFTGVGSESEFIGYYTICRKINIEKWQTEWDENALAPYMYKGDQWATYENIKSIQSKVEYIMKYSLGGAAGIFIEDDDFLDNCGNGAYPLLKGLKKSLESEPKMKSEFAVEIKLIRRNKTSKLTDGVGNLEGRFEL